MKRVAICFSGHPRTFLNNTASWNRYFSLIREEYLLSIYFHCWADHGLVRFSDGKYIEGELECGRYANFQELIEYLEPAAFAIESFSPELIVTCRDFPPVLLTSWQASRKKILSQLYSVSRADSIRRGFEESGSNGADVVIRMRFDVEPINFTMNEIRYVAAHPGLNVLFAPSPAWHVHPGGGGGCRECHAFFDANWLEDDIADRANKFIECHPRHSNDICDLFAISNPIVMEQYTKIFSDARTLSFQLFRNVNSLLLSEYNLVPDTHDARDSRIIGTKSLAWNIEDSWVFVPEKLIRLKMAGFLVVHGESIFVIDRR